MGQVVNPVILEKGLKATFFKAYDLETTDHGQLVTEVPSTGPSEKYGWLGSAPEMSEWKDERTPKGLLDHDYTIKNVHYEASIGVDRDTLEDDQMGQIKVRVADMATRAKVFPKRLLFNPTGLIVGGTSQLCYDGQYYFDNDHLEGASGVQDNLLAGSGASLANVTTDFVAARAAMFKFLDDQGEIFHVKQPQLLVAAPIELMNVFEQLFNNSRISGSDNELKGAAKLMSYPFADVDDWYLFNIGGYLKPFVLQVRTKLGFETLEQKSEAGFMKKHYYYGVDQRLGAGYGLWQNAVKTVN